MFQISTDMQLAPTYKWTNLIPPLQLVVGSVLEFMIQIDKLPNSMFSNMIRVFLSLLPGKGRTLGQKTHFLCLLWNSTETPHLVVDKRAFDDQVIEGTEESKTNGSKEKVVERNCLQEYQILGVSDN